MIEFRDGFYADVRTEDVRSALSEMDGLNVQTSGERNDGIFQIKVKVGDDVRACETVIAELRK